MSICQRCEKLFTCGLLEGDPTVPCWCTQLPALPPHQLGLNSALCYCPACLRALTSSDDISSHIAPEQNTK